MSVRPASADATPAIPRKKVTIQALHALRQAKTPITMVTAYDYPSALACSSSLLTDITLVGDSLAQVCLGYASTTQLTLDEMIHHAKAVARGTTHPFLVADMPFGSYYTSTDAAVANAVRLVQEGRVEGVKLEGGREIVDVVRRLTAVGIPVMAHVGLLPQRHSALSGYKVQGRSVEAARRVLADALALEDAGAFAVLIEAVPQELGRYVTERVKVPTIGIGAGPGTSGQVGTESIFCTICSCLSEYLGSCCRRSIGGLVGPQGQICSSLRASEGRPGQWYPKLLRGCQRRNIPASRYRKLHYG